MRAGIALGSNLGDRLAQLRRACAAVAQLPGVSEPILCSSIYETEPVDTETDAVSFLNAVMEVEYAGHPVTLLGELQRLEAQMGRPSKRPRNASRTIDLDILYAGNLVLTNTEVVIPHPRISLRRFVLQPLLDIRPDLLLPGKEANIRELLAGLKDSAQVEQIGETLRP